MLQAEVEFWHEMLQLNDNRLPLRKKEEMRGCLKAAVRALNAAPRQEFQAAA